MDYIQEFISRNFIQEFISRDCILEVFLGSRAMVLASVPQTSARPPHQSMNWTKAGPGGVEAVAPGGVRGV